MHLCSTGNHLVLIGNKCKWQPHPLCFISVSVCVCWKELKCFLDDYLFNSVQGVHSCLMWGRQEVDTFLGKNGFLMLIRKYLSCTLLCAITHAYSGIGCLTLSTAVSLPRQQNDEFGHYWWAEWTRGLSSRSLTQSRKNYTALTGSQNINAGWRIDLQGKNLRCLWNNPKATTSWKPAATVDVNFFNPPPPAPLLQAGVVPQETNLNSNILSICGLVKFIQFCGNDNQVSVCGETKGFTDNQTLLAWSTPVLPPSLRGD